MNIDQAIQDLQQRLVSSDSDPDRLLKRAVLASGSGITIADARKPDLPLIYVNPAFERMTGFTAEEAIGHNCRFLHRGEPDQKGLDEVRAAIREERDGMAVLRNYRNDGSLFWNELYISPIRDAEGRLTHFIGVQNDVTARVELEEAREFFLQVASHDLKSPLHAMLMTASTLEALAPVGSTVSEKMHGLLSNIANRAREMQGIIEDYLDLQELEAGRVETKTEPLDIPALMEEVLEANAEPASKKRITMERAFDADLPPVRADGRKVKQVAQNLLSNAVKFSAQESRVTVRIGLRGERLRVEVVDEGPGLSDEDLRHVFGKFARLSNKPTGGEKSSGLGLHIAKCLIEAQGGEIGVFNNEDRGATFWFSLPMTESG